MHPINATQVVQGSDPNQEYQIQTTDSVQGAQTTDSKHNLQFTDYSNQNNLKIAQSTQISMHIQRKDHANVTSH